MGFVGPSVVSGSTTVVLVGGAGPGTTAVGLLQGTVGFLRGWLHVRGGGAVLGAGLLAGGAVSPELIGWREDSRMAPTSTGVTAVDLAPQNGCHQRLHPQGELHLPPASLGGSPPWASVSDPGSLQTAVSRKILSAPFKSGVSVSHSPLALPGVYSAVFQTQMF